MNWPLKKFKKKFKKIQEYMHLEINSQCKGNILLFS